jgi:hypothetical protein
METEVETVLVSPPHDKGVAPESWSAQTHGMGTMPIPQTDDPGSRKSRGDG